MGLPHRGRNKLDRRAHLDLRGWPDQAGSMEAFYSGWVRAPGGTRVRDMTDDFALAETTAAEFLLLQTTLCPRIGLVLGSGLGGFADELTEATRIPYANIPGFPRSTAVGHAGQIVVGNAGDVAVVAMQGRVHLYEGYSAREVSFPTRVLGRMGLQALIITNAAGGINLEYKQGALVVLTDHINLQEHNPLVGANDDRFGPTIPRHDAGVFEAVSRDRASSSQQTGQAVVPRCLRWPARPKL